MSKKINNQVVIYILVAISLISSIAAIAISISNSNKITNLAEKDTHNDIVIRTKIECLQNPSDECRKELQRVEKNLEDFINKSSK